MSPLDIATLVNAKAAGPRSILRLMQVLARLAAVPEGQRISELSRAVSVPKTTLFTMLKVLEQAGYLAQTDGVYRLGREAIALGAAMAKGRPADFPECARGILADTARRTGETAFLAVLAQDGLSCRYVAVVESENWLRYSVRLGSSKPAFATGTGRAMLAYLPEARVRKLLSGVKFEPITEKTVASRRALLADLKEVRRRGVSVVDGGTVAGVVSVAAPIFGPDGEVMAAISVGGPTARLAWRQRAVSDAVRDAAREISVLLGWHGPWPAALK